MRPSRSGFLLLLGAACLLGQTAPAWPGEPLRHFSWGQQTREYRLLPATQDSRALIVLLHGLGSDSRFFEGQGFPDWINAFRNRGYNFLIPDALDSSPAGAANGTVHRAWNGGDPVLPDPDDCCFSLYTRYFNHQRGNSSSRPFVSSPAPDDTGALQALIKATASSLGIASDSVAVIGISNGGILAYRLQCNLPPGSFGAIISIQGALTGMANCSSGAARRFLHIHGDKDDIVPFRGGRTLIAPLDPDYFFRRSPQDSLALVARAAGCRKMQPGSPNPAPSPVRPDMPEMEWSMQAFACRNHLTRFFFLTYHGAGHELRISMFGSALAFSAWAFGFTDVPNTGQSVALPWLPKVVSR
jgi:poly(3-hydroxybutyrate) depolymerase